jgi:uncharacterized damage-inducible protein DinB
MTTTDAITTGDTAILLDFLAGQQRRITGIVDGLDEETLRQVLLPSGWSCAGMIQHLTLMTRFWFVEVMDGRPDEHGDEDEFHVPETVVATTLVDRFSQQAREAAELVRDLPLETTPAWWPEGAFGGWRLENLHEVLLHVIVETSTHAGHLDIVRELTDGRTWDYPTGRLTPATP